MKNITVFRDPKQGFLHYALNGKTYQLNTVQGNTFKIFDKEFTGTIISRVPEFKFHEIATEDGVRTFIYLPISTQTRRVIGAGGGGGIRGIIVQDAGTTLPGYFNTFNFTGAVTVTDNGNGRVTIDVGSGMIGGGGTLNRIAMFTPDGSNIGDSPLLRSGTDVVADGFIYFASGNGIDVTASGGSDVLNIGASNADVINYGYSGTTHNFSGSVFNESTTNLNVKDKLITINDGGAAASGGNAGFEIEEAGVATGYFIQNATRNGFDFQASAITGVATFSLSLLTGNQTATLQDASGTLAYLSDIPSVTGFFANGGNAFGGDATLGTNDAFALYFETSGSPRGSISATGFWGINTANVAGQLLTMQGTGATNATYLIRAYNSTPTEIFYILNNANMYAGTAVGINTAPVAGQPLTAQGSGATSATFSVRIYNSTPTEIFSVRDDSAIIINASRAITLNLGGLSNNFFGTLSGSASASNANNTSVGASSLGSITGGYQNSALGVLALGSITNGGGNTAMGYLSCVSTTGNDNTAYGSGSLQSNVTGGTNTAIGLHAGFSSTVGGNVFIGYYSGNYATTAGDEFYLNDRDRTNNAGDISLSLMYGKFGTNTVNQFLRHNSNVGIGTSTFGTNADLVFAIANGTAPTTDIADQFQMYSADQAAGNAAPHFRTENGSIIKLYLQTLTNSTGGAATGDLEDVTTAGLADPAKVNNNFTELYTILDNLGLV